MADDKILGLAHFTEHMLFLGSKKYPNVTFFNDFITSNEGHFNGFTDKDSTAFIYEINKEKFEESLDVFLNFFVKPLFKPEYIEKEIFAVNSEYEKNLHYEEKRFDRMFQTLANPNHPFNKFSTGNKETIKIDSRSDSSKSIWNLKNKKENNEKELRENVIKYFHKNYIGRNIKLVLYTNYALDDIKKILINNMIKIKNNHIPPNKQYRMTEFTGNTTQSESEIQIFTEKEKGKIIFYKSKYKSLKIFYIIDDFKDPRTSSEFKNPKSYFKAIFSLKTKNSLHENLVKQRLIFNSRVDFKNKYQGLYAIYFDFMLTELGLKNVDLIIKLLSQYIKIVHNNVNNREVFDVIAKEGNKKFFARPGIKKPYVLLKKWIKNFYLYSKNDFVKSDNLIDKFRPEILNWFVGNMTIHNMIAFVGSRSFKRINETHLYKILMESKTDGEIENNISHNSSPPKNFNHMEFLNKKEKWYKAKFREFKLNNEQILHLFKRRSNSTNLNFPIISKKGKILNYFANENLNSPSSLGDFKNNLCDKHKKSDCEKIFKNDKTILAPSLIYISDILKMNSKIGDIYSNLSSNRKPSITNNTEDTQLDNSKTYNITFYSEIYHKLDMTHLKKSFMINMKIIPDNSLFDLQNPRTVPLIKFLILIMNFKYSENLLDPTFLKNSLNEKISLNFLDNFRMSSNLFKWRNSKEKLTADNFMIDGIYLRIKANSEESFEKSDLYKMIETILSQPIEKKDFRYLKEELFRQMEFYKSTIPSHQALSWLFRLGFKYDINYFNMTHEIKKISFEEINEFKSNIFSNLKFISLAYGTITEEKAKNYIQNLEKIFLNTNSNANSISQAEYQQNPLSSINNNSYMTLSQIKKRQRFMQAPYTKYGSLFIFQQNNLFKFSPDSTTLNVYFLGQQNIRNIANIKIISHIAGNIFFSYLRIKHQLGYSIKHKLLNINHNLIFYVHVQGSKKHPSHINKYIDKALHKIKKKLNQIDEIGFNRVKDSVYNQIFKQPNKLELKNNFYWGFIQGEENIFNKEKMKAYINHLSISDLVKFIDYILERKLSIQVANQSAKYDKIDKESIYVNNVDYFRKIGNFKRPDINEKEYEEIIVKPDFNPELLEAFKKVNRYEN